MADTSFAGLSSFKVDKSELLALQKAINQLRLQIGPLFDSVRPTFGAYMRYSAVLEYGWRDGRLATFHLQGGATVVSSSGVPHIGPAITTNRKLILDYITKWFLDNMASGLAQKGKAAYNNAAMKDSLEKAWGKILNDKPRRDAVKGAPYQYGFHRRSIQGSGKGLSDAEIAMLRAEQDADAKARAVAAHDKSVQKRLAKRLENAMKKARARHAKSMERARGHNKKKKK